MRSILEFALFAWVGISVVAVLIQLVRIARYKRAAASATPAPSEAVTSKPPTIDLEKRLATSSKAPAPDAGGAAPQAMAGAPTIDGVAQHAATPTAAAPAPSAPTAPAQAAPAAPAPSAPTAPAQAAPAAPAPSAPAAPIPAPAAPTLADLLAGVRLPWNLLPTVDQSREPSNDHVVLITSEGEPADIGVDVADELERLGFTIAPRGDDTAVATRGDHSLGLQIIADPMAAEVDGTPRFPTATESSVALDIWIDS